MAAAARFSAQLYRWCFRRTGQKARRKETDYLGAYHSDLCLAIAVFGTLGAFSTDDKGRQTLDLDSAAKPLIETGYGDISSSGDGVDDFNMTVNGKTLKLTQVIYYGVDGDISASLASAPYYTWRLTCQTQSKSSSRKFTTSRAANSVANFTDFPDASGSYKPSLKERYQDVANTFNGILFGMAILVAIAGWCGWYCFQTPPSLIFRRNH